MKLLWTLCLLSLTHLSLFSAEKVCSLKRFGKLTMFNGDEVNVELPCRYCLSDFTCGAKKYRAWVTLINGHDKDNNGNQTRFSPSGVKVRFDDPETEEIKILKSDVDLLEKAIADNGTTSPWEQRNGTLVVDEIKYSESDKAAVTRMGDITVKFTYPKASGDDAGVTVTCSSDTIESKSVSKALCGDAVTPREMAAEKKNIFGEDNNDTLLAHTIHYLILSNAGPIQNPECGALSEQFKACPKKVAAVQQCEAIFGSRRLSTCLEEARPSQEWYADCLNNVCNDNSSGTDLLDKWVNGFCPELTDLSAKVVA